MGWGEPRIFWSGDHNHVVGNTNDIPTELGAYTLGLEAMWRIVRTEIGFDILRDMGPGSFDYKLHCERGDSSGLCIQQR
jgi:hypothetical protein